MKITLQQKAKNKAHQIYDQYWSAVSRGPVCKTDELPDIRPLLEQAIIDAVEEERDACAMIADEFAKAEAEAASMFGRNQMTVPQATHTIMSVVCGRIRNEIRGRSKS